MEKPSIQMRTPSMGKPHVDKPLMPGTAPVATEPFVLKLPDALKMAPKYVVDLPKGHKANIYEGTFTRMTGDQQTYRFRIIIRDSEGQRKQSDTLRDEIDVESHLLDFVKYYSNRNY